MQRNSEHAAGDRGSAASRREGSGPAPLGGRQARAPGANEPLAALLAALHTSPGGLSSEEAGRRRPGGGIGAARSSRGYFEVVVAFRHALADPLVLILLVAGVASAFLGETTNASLIAAIVLASAGINAWQTLRSDRAVRALQAKIAPLATVLRDGAWRELPRGEVVPGDVVRLSAGDLVPADARILEATDLHVQQAALTGESLPVEKRASPGPIAIADPHADELLFLGTSIVSGTAQAVVFAVGADTAFGDVIERLAARPAETEFERGTRRFGLLILKTVFFLVFFILVVNIAEGRNALESVLFSVALAVGLTPEFLPMITTVTLARGALQMSRQKVIVKHLQAIQNLGSIDVLCSDKTGTLTSGRMSLDASLDPLGQRSERAIDLAAANSQHQSGLRSPLDDAILERAQAQGGLIKVGEIPFDFERRRLSVIVRQDAELLLITKGAPESVLAVCTAYEARSKVATLDPTTRQNCLATFESLSREGFRVLAVAYRRPSSAPSFRAADERELTLAGFLTFADHPLADASVALDALRRDGVVLKVLTGDNELVTRHVCAEVGLDGSTIVLGQDIERLDEGALARVAEQHQVFARVSPAQKHRIIRALQTRGHVVGY
ncbi:MAG TPA: HAD-IC family P-type ATPase, partial [Polyangiaceae bacterium]|nr:HAD-IC family P-type ATPase [Polyangiaceae bacterium]